MYKIYVNHKLIHKTIDKAEHLKVYTKLMGSAWADQVSYLL